MEGDNKIFNVLSYVNILWLVGLLAKPNEQDVRFHVNQGIILSIVEVASIILSTLLAFTIIVPILMSIVGLVTFVFAIMGIVNAFKGEQKELPIIGKFRILK